MKSSLSSHLTALPTELQGHLEAEFESMRTHYALSQWAAVQVDAGRFAEVILRVIEWKVSGSYTPIDGKSKPDRKKTINSVRQTPGLPDSLRLQIADITEIIMDFRNNRNSAHLGSIDPSEIDASTVVSLACWIVGELIRLHGGAEQAEVQKFLNQLAERPVPLIYEINDKPIVLDPTLNHKDVLLLVLFHAHGSMLVKELFKHTQHTHITRWKSTVLGQLIMQKMVYVDDNGYAHLLPAGVQRAEELIKAFIS